VEGLLLLELMELDQHQAMAAVVQHHLFLDHLLIILVVVVADHIEPDHLREDWVAVETD
jgi:hypothetical protein